MEASYNSIEDVSYVSIENATDESLVLIEDYIGKYIKLVVDGQDPNGYAYTFEKKSTTTVNDITQYKARLIIDADGALIDAYLAYSLDEDSINTLTLLNNILALLIRDTDANLKYTPIEEIMILNLVFSSIYIDYQVSISSSVDLDNTKQAAEYTITNEIVELLVDFANENSIGDVPNWDSDAITINNVSSEVPVSNKLTVQATTLDVAIDSCYNMLGSTINQITSSNVNQVSGSYSMTRTGDVVALNKSGDTILIGESRGYPPGTEDQSNITNGCGIAIVYKYDTVSEEWNIYGNSDSSGIITYDRYYLGGTDINTLVPENVRMSDQFGVAGHINDAGNIIAVGAPGISSTTTGNSSAVSYTHLTLPTNREV